jgi:uncharacterized membrane protein
MGVFESVAAFISGSVYLFCLALSAGWLGRHITQLKTRKIRILSFPLFVLAVSLIVHTSAQLILTPATASMLNLILSVAGGFGLLAVALVIEWKTKS